MIVNLNIYTVHFRTVYIPGYVAEIMLSPQKNSFKSRLKSGSDNKGKRYSEYRPCHQVWHIWNLCMKKCSTLRNVALLFVRKSRKNCFSLMQYPLWRDYNWIPSFVYCPCCPLFEFIQDSQNRAYTEKTFSNWWVSKYFP